MSEPNEPFDPVVNTVPVGFEDRIKADAELRSKLEHVPLDYNVCTLVVSGVPLPDSVRYMIANVISHVPPKDLIGIPLIDFIVEKYKAICPPLPPMPTVPTMTTPPPGPIQYVDVNIRQSGTEEGYRSFSVSLSRRIRQITLSDILEIAEEAEDRDDFSERFERLVIEYLESTDTDYGEEDTGDSNDTNTEWDSPHIPARQVDAVLEVIHRESPDLYDQIMGLNEEEEEESTAEDPNAG